MQPLMLPLLLFPGCKTPVHVPLCMGDRGAGDTRGRTRASSMAEDAGADVPSYHHDEQIIPCISERWKEEQAGGKALFFRDIALYFGCSCQTPLALKPVDWSHSWPCGCSPLAFSKWSPRQINYTHFKLCPVLFFVLFLMCLPGRERGKQSHRPSCQSSLVRALKV